MSDFNTNQLATYQQAKDLRGKLNSHPEFKDCLVLPGDDQTKPSVQNPGIYIPVWETGPHSDPLPGVGPLKFLHLRFTNGFSGMNVGLALDKFRRYPTSPQYVIEQLAKEVKGLK